MDISIRRIVITEDVDLDLDKLLLGDNSGAKLSASPSSPPLSLPSSSPPSALTNNATSASTAAQCVGQISPARPLLARDDDGEDSSLGHWILPAPARPGDHINNSLHKVPSKSILKKTSSYANFDSSVGGGGSITKKTSSFLSFGMDSSSTSQGSLSRNSRSQVANNPLNTSLSGGRNKTTKKSFLNLASLTFNNDNESQGSQAAIGWDLDDSTPSYSLGPPNSLRGKIAFDTVGADRAAGMDSSGSRHSGTSNAKMRHNVSFHSVNVREYDRIVGDNPSCRSGPPLSLDWSYSKNTEKNLEEFELERSTDRVKNIRKLHVNKYKRKNLLSFHWGHSEEEFKEARKSTKKMQRQRSMTKMMLPLNKPQEAYISFKNFIKKKKGDGTDDGDDFSEMSNSASTKGSCRHSGTPSRSSHQDTRGSSHSAPTT
mmetsp:Transcript_12156/g.19652  ORF Transcript_12156/g.19652 Transcript_12156/m.19652 type:complete len:429 (+) Transcript_12156:22-1308(+)